MSKDFMQVRSIEDVIISASGSLEIYKQLKATMENEANTIEGALKLSIKFLSLSDTLSECIYHVSEHVRVAVTAYTIQYASIINQGHDSVAKAEMKAKNDPTYINGKFTDAQRLQNYLDYLVTVKADSDKSHYICKEAYSRQSDMFMATYRNKQ